MYRLLKHIHGSAFLLLLTLAVITSAILPLEGPYLHAFKLLTQAAIALLFFMHGAKLSRQAMIEGIKHWRLHLLILCISFVLFPTITRLILHLNKAYIPNPIAQGFIFLSVLPATVQSAIAFTAQARGNVAAAVCSASLSSVIGVFLSPFLIGLLMHTTGSFDTLRAIKEILIQLICPFILGHLCRPILLTWLMQHTKAVQISDQSAILLVVYLAFSQAASYHLWAHITWQILCLIILISTAILIIILCLSTYLARTLGFHRADEITLVFGASKKSLANGVPIANILFPAASLGVILLPLMVFHQIQLMVCAHLAQRYAKHKTIR